MPISRATASFVQDIANWALLLGLVIGVVATFVIVRMGAIKEEYSQQELGAANASAAKANESAAMAQERAARLEKEAAQARAGGDAGETASGIGARKPPLAILTRWCPRQPFRDFKLRHYPGLSCRALRA